MIQNTGEVAGAKFVLHFEIEKELLELVESLGNDAKKRGAVNFRLGVRNLTRCRKTVSNPKPLLVCQNRFDSVAKIFILNVS